MEEIDKIIESLNDEKAMLNEMDIRRNRCLEILNEKIPLLKVEKDVVLTAKAFSSLLNNVVNKKIEYINYLIDGQLELLSFLKTFDDKYLSNIERFTTSILWTELSLIQQLEQNIFDIEDFLSGFLDEFKKN